MQKTSLNKEVTIFLDELKHPLRKEIELLRECVLGADKNLEENVKWNGPNYSLSGNDRVTMKIQPPKNVQLIFHRGAKVKEQPKEKLIKNDFGILDWKENDRAVATFKTMEEIKANAIPLRKVIEQWLLASM